MAAYGIGEVAQYVALLPLASLRDSEQAGSGDFAVAAAVAETDLAPLDGGAQDPLRYIVGRLHSLTFQKREQQLPCAAIRFRTHPPYSKRFGEICPGKSTGVPELLLKLFPRRRRPTVFHRRSNGSAPLGLTTRKNSSGRSVQSSFIQPLWF